MLNVGIHFGDWLEQTHVVFVPARCSGDQMVKLSRRVTYVPETHNRLMTTECPTLYPMYFI